MPPLSRVRQSLVQTQSPLRAILLGWPTVTIPALVLAWLTTLLFPSGAHPAFGPVNPVMFFLITVFAPVVETLIMAFFLELMLRLRIPPAVAVGASAIGWGLAHSYQAIAWGLVIWWPFLIFSTLYVVWRERSYLWALLIPMAVHALNNLVPALTLLRNG